MCVCCDGEGGKKMYRINLIPINYDNIKHIPPVDCRICSCSAVGNLDDVGPWRTQEKLLKYLLNIGFCPPESSSQTVSGTEGREHAAPRR